MRCPFVVLEKSCAGALAADDAGLGTGIEAGDLTVGSPSVACDLQYEYLRSFRTRERVDDSKATPSITTSRVEGWACVVASGFMLGGGRTYLEFEL